MTRRVCSLCVAAYLACSLMGMRLGRQERRH